MQVLVAEQSCVLLGARNLGTRKKLACLTLTCFLAQVDLYKFVVQVSCACVRGIRLQEADP